MTFRRAGAVDTVTLQNSLVLRSGNEHAVNMYGTVRLRLLDRIEVECCVPRIKTLRVKSLFQRDKSCGHTLGEDLFNDSGLLNAGQLLFESIPFVVEIFVVQPE